MDNTEAAQLLTHIALGKRNVGEYTPHLRLALACAANMGREGRDSAAHALDVLSKADSKKTVDDCPGLRAALDSAGKCFSAAELARDEKRKLEAQIPVPPPR